MLNWLAEEKQITPHIPVIYKSKREDGTFSRAHFRYDAEQNIYVCPAGKTLMTTGTLVMMEPHCSIWRESMIAIAANSKHGAVRRRRSAKSRVISTNTRATLPGPSSAQCRSSGRAGIANVLKCGSHIEAHS